MDKEEKQKWVLDYISKQLTELSSRWADVETQLVQAKIEVANLEREKCHYDTIMMMLNTVRNNLTIVPKNAKEET